MTDETTAIDPKYEEFCAKAHRALCELFTQAQSRAEVQFAWALAPEMRGLQDAGWNTASEAFSAVEEFKELLTSLDHSRIKIRVALSLYSHLSEASGFYEVPKNMMRIASGEEYNTLPFRHLVQNRQERGGVIAPNANKIMKDLIAHADELNLVALQEVLLEAFDPELRNGYAHADYIIWTDGIRLRKRNGGQPRFISFEEFGSKLDRGLAFFEIMKHVIGTFIESYHPAKRVVGAPNNNDPEIPTIIKFDPETRRFSITSGLAL